MASPRLELFPSAPPSPLDPFLVVYLNWLDELPGGNAPAGLGPTVGPAMDWQPAFGEAIFVSARGRGLIEPVLGRGARLRQCWQISARGRAWLTREQAILQLATGEVIAETQRA